MRNTYPRAEQTSSTLFADTGHQGAKRFSTSSKPGHYIPKLVRWFFISAAKSRGSIPGHPYLCCVWLQGAPTFPAIVYKILCLMCSLTTSYRRHNVQENPWMRIHSLSDCGIQWKILADAVCPPLPMLIYRHHFILI